MIYRKNYVNLLLLLSLLFYVFFLTSEFIIPQSAHIDSSYITKVVTL